MSILERFGLVTRKKNPPPNADRVQNPESSFDGSKALQEIERFLGQVQELLATNVGAEEIFQAVTSFTQNQGFLQIATVSSELERVREKHERSTFNTVHSRVELFNDLLNGVIQYIVEEITEKAAGAEEFSALKKQLRQLKIEVILLNELTKDLRFRPALIINTSQLSPGWFKSVLQVDARQKAFASVVREADSFFADAEEVVGQHPLADDELALSDHDYVMIASKQLPMTVADAMQTKLNTIRRSALDSHEFYFRSANSDSFQMLWTSVVAIPQDGESKWEVQSKSGVFVCQVENGNLTPYEGEQVSHIVKSVQMHRAPQSMEAPIATVVPEHSNLEQIFLGNMGGYGQELAEHNLVNPHI